MANEEGLPTLTQAYIMKEGELSYVKLDNQDDLQDEPKKTRRKSWIRTSSTENILLFLDEEHDEEKQAFMTLKFHEISRIKEAEKKFLCLEYGPKNERPMFILLDFTNEPSGCLEDWENALLRMMGKTSPRRRRKTETSQTMNKPNQNQTPKRAQSTFLPTTSLMKIPEIQIPMESPQTPEDVFEKPFSGTASGGVSPGAASTGSDTGSDLSPFSSLKSTYSYDSQPEELECKNDPQPEKLECKKECLSQTEFKDHKGEIFVTKTSFGSGLHIGDVISGISVNKAGPDNKIDTRRLEECIRETQDETIKLDVQRGVEIIIKEEEMGSVINIKGSKARRPDTVDVVMKVCNGETELAIAEIDGKPVGTQTDEVTQRVREVLTRNCESRLHLIPQSLRTVAEADGEPPNDDDNAKDGVIVEEVRSIDEGAPGQVILDHNSDVTEC